MKKSTLLFIACIAFAFTTQAQNANTKPTYAGHIDYTRGGFDGYNYPVQGDSVLVYTGDSSKINVVVFPKKGVPANKNLNDVNFSNLKLLKKQRFVNIITPDKSELTNNYDVMFSNEEMMPKGSTVCKVNLTHYSDGSDATLTLMVENNGVQMYDMFVAELKRLKP